jgi:hypothetical protein
MSSEQPDKADPVGGMPALTRFTPDARKPGLSHCAQPLDQLALERAIEADRMP